MTPAQRIWEAIHHPLMNCKPGTVRKGRKNYSTESQRRTVLGASRKRL